MMIPVCIQGYQGKMPRRSKKDTFEIAVCLDEIETAHSALEKKCTPEQKKVYESWVRQMKARLKELNYKGKMPRKTRR